MSYSPYKFLDPYSDKPRDQKLFFGRERETQILESDIIVGRLVVLFAKTGTGKTSLINAGVRPSLKERDYNTYFIRVSRNPIAAAKLALSNQNAATQTNSETGAAEPASTSEDSLITLLQQVEKPVVIFFDQFEEFFIYTRRDPGTRNRFISDIAEIYRNKSLGIYVVFSMREEFFYEMDHFRDKIPDIFHKDSSLRLRGLDKGQVRQAIKFPALKYGVKIENALVRQLIEDLSKDEDTYLPNDGDGEFSGAAESSKDAEIDPTQLQVVCDTLWRKKVGKSRDDFELLETIGRQYREARTSAQSRLLLSGGKSFELIFITLEDYRKLGQDKKGSNIARQILNQRLLEEFEKIASQRQLEILEKLLPLLVVEQGPKTKNIVDLKTLPKELDAEKDELDDLLVKLEEWRVIRRSRLGNSEFIELSHDYLAKSLDELHKQVRTIWPRRLLNAALKIYRERAPSVKSQDIADILRPEELATISKHANDLMLTEEQTRFLFHSAVVYGLYRSMWFELASRKGLEPSLWKILETDLVAEDIVQAFHVVDFLGELQTPRAFELLKKALGRNELASYTLEVLSRIENVAAVRILAEASKQNRLKLQAKEALTRLRRTRRNPEVASLAESSWKTLADSTASPPPKDQETGYRTYDYHLAERAGRSEPILTPPFAYIGDSLRRGHVIPFIGTGAAMASREPNERWIAKRSEYLPSAIELAGYLAELAMFPQDKALVLAEVAQYFATIAGRDSLQDHLHDIFDHDYPITPLHEFLVSLPAPLLIVTTNYDDVLERAFHMKGRPFNVVAHTNDSHLGDRLLWWEHGADEPQQISPNKFYIDLNETAVIYKMHGTVDRRANHRDQYVITEDDYIEFLTRMSKNKAIPAIFAEPFQTRNFLFLGYGLRDWNLRVVLNRIDRDLRRPRGLASWAIQYGATPLELRFWQERNVKVYDMALNEFVLELAKINS